jgi:hypothetical protein
MRVTDSTELDHINDLIHDRWFSTADIDHKCDAGALVIPFSNDDAADRRALCTVKEQPHAAALIFRNVNAFEFRDSQRIVWYDFNRVNYDTKSGNIDIVTNIPLLLRVKVSKLDIEVQPLQALRGAG